MAVKENLKLLVLRICHYNYFRRFKKYGKNIHISRNGIIKRPEEIVMGNNIYINSNFHISARSLVFGNNILIGPNFVVECDNHIFNIPGKTIYEIRNERKIEGVEFENDIWIGANVVILPGVKIYEGCIIGAGSVVTKSLEPYSICVGVPCKEVKEDLKKEDLKKHLSIIKSKYSIDQFDDNYWKIN